jgi:Fe-Mn family superoxide dismutase
VGLPSLGGLEPSFTADGVPGLLSKKGFEIAWTTYQQFIMKKLANLVAGEGIDIHNPRAIAIQYARDPMNASLFNHASMVHNNHFFFQGLSTRPIPLEHEKALQAKLVAQFGSVENLRTSFIESAAGMFGPGFTWLVWNPSTRQQGTGGFKILNTYGAGTPYGEAGHRRQETDMSNSSSTPSYGQMGAYSKSGQKDGGLAPGAARLYPLMCVNTWQHVYLYEYGVEGKREFLNRWWDVIDWSVVQRTLKAVEGTMAKSGNAARGSGARKFLER